MLCWEPQDGKKSLFSQRRRAVHFSPSDIPYKIYFSSDLFLWSIWKTQKIEAYHFHCFSSRSLSDSSPRPLFACDDFAAKARSIFWYLTRILLIFYLKISSCFRQVLVWGWFRLDRASPHYFLMTFPAASFHFPPSTTIWYLISTSMLI